MNTMIENIDVRIYPAPVFVTGLYYIRLLGAYVAQTGAGSRFTKLAITR